MIELIPKGISVMSPDASKISTNRIHNWNMSYCGYCNSISDNLSKKLKRND